MKFEKNSKLAAKAFYAFLALASAILFYLALQHLGVAFVWLKRIVGFIMPVIYGFIFAYLLNPLMRVFDNKLLPGLFKKMKPSTRRGISILVTYIIALLFIALCTALIIPQIIYSLIGIGANVPSYLKILQTLYYQMTDSIANYQILEDAQSTQIMQTAFTYILNASESLLETLGIWLTRDLPNIAFNLATSFTSGVIDVILGVIISIYFLADREKLFAQLSKITHAIFKDNTVKLLYGISMDTHRMFSGFIIGKIIDSLIVGVICFIVMSIIGFPYTMLISVIVGVTNVIPYFGPFIGAIPGFLLIFISDPVKGPMQSLLFLIFILVLQQFDGNILGPKILGDTTGLSALWVIFSIMLFSGLFGIPGMFIGVPLFAVIYNLLKQSIAYILAKKGKPIDTQDYASDRNPLIR